MCRWVSHFHLCSCLFFLSHPSFPTNSPDLRRVGGVQRRRFGLVALEGKIRKAALSCWTAAQGTWRDLAAPRLCSEELGCSWGLGVCCFFVGELSWSSIFQVSKCSIWNPIGYGETGWFGRTVFFGGSNQHIFWIDLKKEGLFQKFCYFEAGYSTPQKGGSHFQLKHLIPEVDGWIYEKQKQWWKAWISVKGIFAGAGFSFAGSKPVRFWFLLKKPPTRAIAIFTPSPVCSLRKMDDKMQRYKMQCAMVMEQSGQIVWQSLLHVSWPWMAY